MQIGSVGIDLGKTTFHLVALSAAGKVLLGKKFTQKQLITFTANMQTSLIGMEACSGASTTHHGQENLFSTERPNTFAQICHSPFAFPLQSCGGPYISGNFGTSLVR